MAWTADSVFEIRPDGALANGCGFSASLGGTDYSQSPTPIVAVADGVTAGTTTVTSATAGFTPLMRGNGLNIAGDGLYQIAAVVSATQVTTDRATANGGAGRSLKVGGCGGAKGVSVSALEPYEFGIVVAGHVIWVRKTNSAGVATAYSINGVNITAAGLEENYVRVEGYGTVRGDGGIANMAQVGNWTAGAYTVIKNLQLAGSFAGSTVIAGATGQVIEDCIVDATGTGGYALSASATQAIRRCWIKGGNSVAAVRDTGGNLFEFCRIDPGAGQAGISVEGGSPVRLQHSAIKGGAVGVQINANSTGVVARSSEFWGASQYGIDVTPTSLHFGQVSLVENCIFGNNGTADIAWRQSSPAAVVGAGGQSWVNATFRCNAFFTLAARYLNMLAAADDVTLTVDPFIDSANGNFNLNSLPGGGALLRSAPCVYGWPDGVNQTALFAGSGGIPTTAAGAASLISLWRELACEPSAIVPDSVPILYIDSGMEALNRRIRFHWTTDSTSIALVAGTDEYAMPVDTIEIRWVQWNGKELPKGSIDEWRARGDDWRNEDPGLPREWAFYGNKVVVRPRPTAEAVAIGNPTLRYCSKPPSIAIAGADQLATQDQRVPVYWGVAEYSASYPDSAAAQQRVAHYSKAFDEESQLLSVAYRDRAMDR